MGDTPMLLDMTNNGKNIGSKYLSHYKRALAIDPSQPDPNFNLGLNFDIEKNLERFAKKRR